MNNNINAYVCAELAKETYYNPNKVETNQGYKIPKGWEVVASSGSRDNL